MVEWFECQKSEIIYVSSNVSIIYEVFMLFYYLFWMIMGFIIHFYIIFGTNLLTGGRARIAVFCLFQCFEEKEYQTESKWNETFGSVIFGKIMIQETWSASRGVIEEATRVGAHPPVSWAPQASTDVLLLPIYTYGPRKHPGAPRNIISTAVTFCIRGIPSREAIFIIPTLSMTRRE